MVVNQSFKQFLFTANNIWFSASYFCIPQTIFCFRQTNLMVLNQSTYNSCSPQSIYMVYSKHFYYTANMSFLPQAIIVYRKQLRFCPYKFMFNSKKLLFVITIHISCELTLKPILFTANNLFVCGIIGAVNILCFQC